MLLPFWLMSFVAVLTCRRFDRIPAAIWSYETTQVVYRALELYTVQDPHGRSTPIFLQYEDIKICVISNETDILLSCRRSNCLSSALCLYVKKIQQRNSTYKYIWQSGVLCTAVMQNLLWIAQYNDHSKSSLVGTDRSSSGLSRHLQEQNAHKADLQVSTCSVFVNV